MIEKLMGRRGEAIATYLTLAIGTEERCYEDIDKQYSKDVEKYYSIYDNSQPKRAKDFDTFPMQSANYLKKSYSIIKDELTKKQSLWLNRVLKKGYKPTLNFMTTLGSRDVFALEEFVKYYADKLGGLEKISGIYLDRCFYVLMYLASESDKQIMQTELRHNIMSNYAALKTRKSIEDMSMVELQYPSEKRRKEEIVNFLNLDGTVPSDVGMLVENIRLIEETAYFETLGNNLELIDEKSRKTFPLTRFMNSLTMVHDVFNVSHDIHLNTKLNDGIIDGVAKLVAIMEKRTGLKENEVWLATIASFYIYSFAKEIDNLRKSGIGTMEYEYLQKSIEEDKARLSKMDEQENELARLKEELAEMKKENASLKTALKTGEKIIDKQGKEIHRLQDSLDKAQTNSKELIFLREYHYETEKALENPDLEDTNISIDSMTKAMSDFKVAIVGGQVNLVKKLKEAMPYAEFFSEREVSRNMTHIRNKDVIFYSSSHNNHSIYDKVMANLERTDAQLIYLSKHGNLNILIPSMYEKMVSHKLIKDTVIQ